MPKRRVEEYNDLIRYLSVFIFFILFLSGCAATVQNAYKPEPKSKAEQFKKEFFAIWDEEIPADYQEVLEGMTKIAEKDGYYGENLMPVNKQKAAELKRQADGCFEYVVHKNGVAVKNTNLRILPTDKPFFEDPKKAGEGYPFDYLQNSALYFSSPLKTLCKSADKSYVFVKSGVGYGWVDARDIALVSGETEAEMRGSRLKTPKNDKTPLYGANGEFLERINIGSVIFDSKAPKRADCGYAYLVDAKTDNGFVPTPDDLGIDGVRHRAYLLFGEPYGWGGYLFNRDCSMFIRDIFVGYGVLLPRNSADQAAGYTDISKLKPEEKKAFIAKNAKPWRSLLYLKGHIMLYIGQKADGEPLVMHDAWGIKSFDRDGKEGRYMLGGIVVTTLEEGKGAEWYDNEKSPILNKILGIKDVASY